MNMMGGAQWNPQEQNPEVDFQHYLDLSMGGMENSINFDFAMLPPSADPLDTTMSGTDHQIPSSAAAGMSQSSMAAITSGAVHSSIPAQMMPATPNDVIGEIDAKIQYLQQQRQQQQQRQMLQEHSQSHRQQHQQPHPMASYFSPNPVPPTPQSLELAAGNANQFYMPSDTPQSAFENRFHSLKEQQDLSFTPLVSPAVTPLEQQQYIDVSFPMTGNYFSPLTSPALHAQPDSLLMPDFRQHGISSKSPVDNTEQWNTTISMSSEQPAKKARKAPGKTTRAKASVRQSPIVKPQRRRGTVASSAASNPSIASQVLNEAEEEAAKKNRSRSIESEENASVSPEALSDMPPPPLPRTKSATASPFIQPQNPQGESSNKATGSRPIPATPASLMRLPSTKTSATSSPATPATIISSLSSPVDSFKLSEAVSFEDVLGSPAIDTPMQSATKPAPVVKNLAPLPSPMFAKPRGPPSATQSPQILPAGSSTPNLRKTPQLAPRNNKRSGSVHASPALLPKISPNIKPLLPNGAEDATSRLLATKSNYQNIIEGNTVPGVTYPSELSTNLTSKRTSHKIAEQGRRNRINSALQEIASLLPLTSRQNAKEDEEGSEKKESKQSAVPNSKASTVEQAIEYIKQLQEQVAAANKRVGELESKLKEKGGNEEVDMETKAEEVSEVAMVAVVETS